MNLENIGKLLIGAALLLAACGAALYLLGRGLGLKSLPGDILYRRGGFTFYFPLGASILLSIIFSVVLTLYLRR